MRKLSDPGAMTFKPLRFFVLMALLVGIACGVVAFYTQRAAHGRTPAERSAYAVGAIAGSEAPRDAKLPYASDMNDMAQKAFHQQGGKAEPLTWKSAFGHGYEDGFKKTHPGT
ncbi:MAG: hypothetical protein ABI992_06675 [Chthoniobacterales bacterium]